MSIFDPLGFLTPYTIRSRILMREVWQSGIGWDDLIHDNEYLRWKEWINDLKIVKDFRLSRCHQNINFQTNSAELHIFCDASSKAYAAVAYWRFIQMNGSFHVSIIMSKSRVAPLKVMTIPRLELQAAVLAVRMAKLISDEHQFKIIKRVFWSDSKIVLHWIKKDPREFKIFVANRLAKIRENSDISEWRWVLSYKY